MISAITELNKFGIPVFDIEDSDSDQCPQIIVYIENTSNSNRAKNERRSSYTLNVDYYDVKDNDNSQMMDNCYMIRQLLQYLKLSNYYCQSVGFDERTSIDTSTSQILRRHNMMIDYEITERAFF
ncbi:hypothetical protein M5C72_02760 [Companilactobacillus allii]|uniref:DUF3168 domain-containing protein n=1 Tax=Companilactobacillus allii TaxID=1847728 RepID=A0A1P8Q2I5_9LACO|nr:hypothetical protein [Companilactobacillus allii]APX72083.1 hypothetical protein BTM29_05675 [Companilactobacillus allii]USQ69176.1 hypothetical protein M5C72_02760 [Companilactobacillus allii]